MLSGIKKVIETHIVPELMKPIRLQEYGVSIFDTIVTKSALKKALKKHLVIVDQLVATSATYIQGGELIQLFQEKPCNSYKTLDLNLKILFEDDYLAAIYKPAGILVSGSHFKTVANALDQNLQFSILPDSTTPRPVHRLDYATTGVLLAGKTTTSIRVLNQLFEQRAIQKTYYAITIGSMQTKEGEINLDVDGKDSHTSYTVLNSVRSKRFKTLNLVRLKPQTGRRHQLRKHLSKIGNPILGDATYGPEDLILKGKGLYLHAYSLDFTHPFTKKHIQLVAILPKKFNKIFIETGNGPKSP